MFPRDAAVNGGIAMGFLFQELFGIPYVNDAVIIGGQIGGHNCVGSQIWYKKTFNSTPLNPDGLANGSSDHVSQKVKGF